jgi:hypothetical protein
MGSMVIVGICRRAVTAGERALRPDRAYYCAERTRMFVISGWSDASEAKKSLSLFVWLTRWHVVA